MIRRERALGAVFLLAVLTAGYLGYLVTPSPENVVYFQAPAVTNDGAGLVAVFKITEKVGTGRLLINIQNARYKQDTEASLLKAKRNAEKYMGVKLTYSDVTIDVTGNNDVVEGESAGAMFTTAIVAVHTGKQFKPYTIASAGITEEGTLFAVDGIEEKILAASAMGKTQFVVAKDQQIRNEEQLPKDIEIIRVETAGEAISHLLN